MYDYYHCAATASNGPEHREEVVGAGPADAADQQSIQEQSDLVVIERELASMHLQMTALEERRASPDRQSPADSTALVGPGPEAFVPPQNAESLETHLQRLRDHGRQLREQASSLISTPSRYDSLDRRRTEALSNSQDQQEENVRAGPYAVGPYVREPQQRIAVPNGLRGIAPKCSCKDCERRTTPKTRLALCGRCGKMRCDVRPTNHYGHCGRCVTEIASALTSRVTRTSYGGVTKDRGGRKAIGKAKIHFDFELKLRNKRKRSLLSLERETESKDGSVQCPG